ncbi:hypothetical protein AYK26_04485 [Euryarchaeota archaeon SM23-78]|nr:MAG: hypothetical protein AYK26_04485 [Euryarchaeota archaeon SM23-78]
MKKSKNFQFFGPENHKSKICESKNYIFGNIKYFLKIFFALALLLFIPNLVFATDWYVRPPGGDYGTEDGTDYDNAWDGLLNVVWGPGGVRGGDNLYICGLHVHEITNPYDNFVSQADIFPVSGNSENERIIIRGDCPGNPGIVWGAYRNMFSNWTHIGGGVWNTSMTGNSDRVWYFQDVGVPNDDSYIVLNIVYSLEELRAHPGGAYYSPDFLGYSPFYVKLTDGSDPFGRVVFNEWGYDFKLNGTSYISFINLKFYGVKRMFKRLHEEVHHIRWENCTLWYASHSIMGFRNKNHHIEMINNDIAWAQNGIGFSVDPVDSPDVPHHITFSNNTIHHIAQRICDGDAHAIWGQGSRDIIIENNIMYNTGTGITFYNWDYQQSMKNMTVRYNWVYNTHTTGCGNSRGIEFNCGEGQGPDTNGECYGNIVGPNVSDVGYRYKWTELSEFYNNVCYDCGISFYISSTLLPYYVSAKLRNIISLNPRQTHIYYASTAEGSYIIDSDYNIFYPISGDQFYFRDENGWGYMNFTEWQALSKQNCTFDPHSIITDPLFVNPDKGDFHLKPGSPAIDTGVDVWFSTDFEGNPVPQGSRPDIGALEYISGTGCGVADLNCNGAVDIFDLMWL